MSIIRFIVLALLFCLILPVRAQMYPVTLEERMAVSSHVVEGKIVAQESRWDEGKNNIYTLNTLAVAKVFKGILQNAEVLILTRGGVVANEKEEVCPSLNLHLNDYGLFTLSPSGVRLKGIGETYFSKGGPQGFIQFNSLDGKLKGVFETYESAERELYPKCKKVTGTAFSVIQDLTYAKWSDSSLNKSITAISPILQTAGTKSTITISGSDFGPNQGVVGFPNADFGGGGNYFPALTSEVISWSDSEIVVEVPDAAGTGQVLVQTAAGNQFLSSAALQIEYAQQLLNYTIPGATLPTTFRAQLVNESSSQGYTWRMNNEFAANTAAVEAFERALETWVDVSCINWSIGANTSVDTVSNDNVNVVLFDESPALFGAIGRCTSRYSACSASNPEWYIEELDIVFDESVNWHFGLGPSPSSMTDFQSVATHELGHGHQLNHVIAPGDVMHFQIITGDTNRDPSPGEAAGATDVMTRSLGAVVCAQSSATESSSCAVADGDGDGVLDDIDNCPNDANPGQEDLDNDLTGDVCDEDIDGDGVDNINDCEPMNPEVSSCSCAGDLNGDELVDISDFIEFNSQFGSTCSGCSGDINSDGIVDILDFLILNTAFGSACP